MDIGLIFRTSAPLDRKHYLVGNAIIWGIGFGFGFIARDTGLMETQKWPLAVIIIWAVIAAVYSLLFRLRRIVDIGFKNWNSAGFALIIYAAIAYFTAKTFGLYPQIAVTGAFELALLLLPTGWNIMKQDGPRRYKARDPFQS